MGAEPRCIGKNGQAMPELIIKAQPDIKVLLDQEPFPFVFTHLSIEVEFACPVNEETGVPIITYETGRILRAYDGDDLLAITRYFDVDPKARTITFNGKGTTLLTPLQPAEK